MVTQELFTLSSSLSDVILVGVYSMVGDFKCKGLFVMSLLCSWPGHRVRGLLFRSRDKKKFGYSRRFELTQVWVDAVLSWRSPESWTSFDWSKVGSGTLNSDVIQERDRPRLPFIKKFFLLIRTIIVKKHSLTLSWAASTPPKNF